MSRWGIIGGGLLGMTLAHRLRQRGEDVTLFEAASELGGLASAWSIGDLVWDKHYHVILLSDAHLRGLLGELGLEDEFRWSETKTGFYTDGQLVSMSDTLEFLRFPPLGPIEKLRLGFTIFYASRIRNWRRLEKVLVGDWLRRWSGKNTYERIWLPLLRAKLGESYTRTSAAFIWATIARMYAARRTGLKKEMFGYVQGGYARILERFAAVLKDEGVRLRLGSSVRRVTPAQRGGVVIDSDGAHREQFDRVIVTTAAPLAARICDGLSDDERGKLEAIEYVGIVCVSVLLKRPLSPYYVTNITEQVPFTAVIEMTALVDPEQFGGHALVYLPKYAAPGDAIFEQSDEQVRESFLGALQRMHPDLRDEEILDFKVSRVRHVFALSTLGYSENLPPVRTSVPGLFVVNSAHIVNGTLNVNETVQLAQRTLPQLLDEPVEPLRTVAP